MADPINDLAEAVNALEPGQVECIVCHQPFTPGRKTQNQCSAKCRLERKRQRQRVAPGAGAAGVGGGGPPRSATLDEQLAEAHARDEVRKNVAEAKKIMAAENRMRRYERVLADVCDQYELTPLAYPDDPSLYTDGEGRASHEWLLVLGDWHVGQKTRIEQTGGMYEQDVSTTRSQVTKLWDAIRRIHAIESTGRRITKLHVLFIGDLVDGDDMRPSQHRNVEDVVTVQTIQGFDLLAWLMRQLMTLFPHVELDMIGGNHDRTGRNRGDAGLGELDYIDTYAWLAGAFMERVLQADIEAGRLSVRNWETFFGFKEVAGKRVVFEHGSSFKWGGGYGGVPWYGISALGPRYGQMLGEPDLVVLGHGHRPALIPHGEGWIVVNGALPATSTYVQSSFKTVQRPQQWLLSMHRDFGPTGFLPLYADVPGQLKAGEIWDDPKGHADRVTKTARGAVHADLLKPGDA